MSRKKYPRVAVIIINWNNWRDTLECLESVWCLDYPDYLTVLVDNGSTDDSLDRICKVFQKKGFLGGLRLTRYSACQAEQGGAPAVDERMSINPPSQRCVFIRSHVNLGFAEGNNLAFRYLLRSIWKPKYLFLLNNDAAIEKNCLRHAVSLAERSGAGVIGASILDAEGKRVLFSCDCRRPELFFMKERKRLKDQPGERSSIQAMGSGMLISREALHAHEKRHGYFFNPRLFMYGEETEFCLDLLKDHFRILVSEKARVFHKEGQSVGETARNSMQIYYRTRNSIAIARKTLFPAWGLFFHLIYAPVRLRIALSFLLRNDLPAARAVLEGLRDGYLNRLGKWRRHPQPGSRA